MNAVFPYIAKFLAEINPNPKRFRTSLNRLYNQHEHDLFGQVRPTIVMDRGIATKDNMLLLKKNEYPYIVVERRAVEKDYVSEFTETKASFQRVDQKQGADLSKIQGTIQNDILKEYAARGTYI